MTLIDTCVLVWDALAPESLSARAAEAVQAADEQRTLCCSDISLWEVSMLVEKGRLDPGTDALTFLRLALAARSVNVLPIQPEIAALSASLPLHGDPADRIIAATALHHGGRLVTADERLRAADEVPTIW